MDAFVDIYLSSSKEKSSYTHDNVSEFPNANDNGYIGIANSRGNQPLSKLIFALKELLRFFKLTNQPPTPQIKTTKGIFFCKILTLFMLLICCNLCTQFL